MLDIKNCPQEDGKWPKHVKVTGDYDGVESEEEMFIHVFTPIISPGPFCTCFGTFYHWSISRCNEK